MNAITKILKELEESPDNRERFNKIDKIYVKLQPGGDLTFTGHGWQFFESFAPITQEAILRIALSRVDGRCVIDCFEGGYDHDKCISDRAYLNDVLYQSFDMPLRNGTTLKYALKSLGDTMDKVGLVW